MKLCEYCEQFKPDEEVSETVKKVRDDSNVLDGSSWRNKRICDGCIDTYDFYKCSECGLYDDDIYAIHGGDYDICSDCFANGNYSCCESCEEYYHNGDMHHDDNASYCTCCYENDFFRCSECEGIFALDYEVYDEDNEECVCSMCHGGGRRPRRDLFPYHSKDGRADKSHGSRYKIGFEVEKEDEDIKIDAQEILDNTGWVIERDGSLSSRIGFEAVSPVYNMMSTEKIREELEKVRFIINAGSSERCGGHIHISDSRRKAGMILRDIHGYLPLLYSMYPKRCENHYCQAKPYHEYRGSRSAVHITYNRDESGKVDGGQKTLELRLFPTPKNVDQLIFRVKLIQHMVENPRRKPYGVIHDLTDTNSGLYRLMKTVYSDEQLAKKIELLIEFSAKLEMPYFRKDIVKSAQRADDFKKEIIYKKSK